MAEFRFRCTECGVSYHESVVRYVCPECSRNQRPGGVTRGVMHVDLARLPRAWPPAPMAHPDSLAAFWPIASAGSLTPLAVGGTPLLPAERLRAELDLQNLHLKDDTRNPTGSTKDRASLLVVAKAREYGFTTVATASTGNAGTALAGVAAAAGLRAVVFVPAGAPEAKLVQMLCYGATVVPIDGTYDDAFDLSLRACERFGWYNRNTAYNPFTIEGKKTAALEIAADLAPQAPDVVVIPVGDGVVLAGLAKGFRDLVAGGLLSGMPRLLAVQPEGSGAIARALIDGEEAITPLEKAASIADSLTVAVPRNAILCLREVRDSGGTGLLVGDDAIVDAIRLLAGRTGVFAEPAGAAALAGLLVAREEKLLDRLERIVLLVTGTGLKDVPAAGRAVQRPRPIPPELDAVARMVPQAEDRHRR